MPNTWTKIASTTVGTGGAGAVTFSSIPNTYTDLCIIGSARMTSAYTSVEFYMIINGDGSTLYSGTLLQAAYSTVTSPRTSNTTYANNFNSPAASNNAGMFGNMSMYMPNYANTSTFKSYSQDSVAAIFTNTNNNLLMSSGLYRSTAAVNSLQMLPTGNWAQHTSFTLYGIKNTP
jgi:hypothetical protein